MISNAYHQRALMNPKSHNNLTADPRTLSGAAMDKPSQDQQQQQQHAQKCPRCDSANTKFCYYNNYSLSQPRHFCKACKRYWTRGGTLRNVPVGGGCRKNKRLKRPSNGATSSNSPNSSSSNLGAVVNSNPSGPASQIDLSPGTSNHHRMTSLFYNRDMSLPFSRFSNSAPGFDHHVSLQPQLGSLGLGFSPSGNNNESNYLNGLIGNYGSIFGAATPASAEPAIASLLASKLTNGGLKDHLSGARGLNFQSLAPFDDELRVSGGVGGGREADVDSGMGNSKHMKLEDGQGIRALDWIHGSSANSCVDPYQTDQIGLSSDPSLFWTNPTSVGGASWHDPANIGSNSVPSLI